MTTVTSQGERFSSTVDQEFSVARGRWLGPSFPISENHVIQDFTAGEAVVGIEEDLPCIILKILESVHEHHPGTARALHVTPPLTLLIRLET